MLLLILRFMFWAIVGYLVFQQWGLNGVLCLFAGIIFINIMYLTKDKKGTK